MTDNLILNSCSNKKQNKHILDSLNPTRVSDPWGQKSHLYLLTHRKLFIMLNDYNEEAIVNPTY